MLYGHGSPSPRHIAGVSSPMNLVARLQRRVLPLVSSGKRTRLCPTKIDPRSISFANRKYTRNVGSLRFPDFKVGFGHDLLENFRELEEIVRQALLNAGFDGRTCILRKDIEGPQL